LQQVGEEDDKADAGDGVRQPTGADEGAAADLNEREHPVRQVQLAVLETGEVAPANECLSEQRNENSCQYQNQLQ